MAIKIAFKIFELLGFYISVFQSKKFGSEKLLEFFQKIATPTNLFIKSDSSNGDAAKAEGENDQSPPQAEDENDQSPPQAEDENDQSPPQAEGENDQSPPERKKRFRFKRRVDTDIIPKRDSWKRKSLKGIAFLLIILLIIAYNA